MQNLRSPRPNVAQPRSWRSMVRLDEDIQDVWIVILQSQVLMGLNSTPRVEFICALHVFLYKFCYKNLNQWIKNVYYIIKIHNNKNNQFQISRHYNVILNNIHGPQEDRRIQEARWEQAAHPADGGGETY